MGFSELDLISLNIDPRESQLHKIRSVAPGGQSIRLGQLCDILCLRHGSFSQVS